MDNSFTIQQATISDVPLILSFIKELAEYEKLSHEVVATEDILNDIIWRQKACRSHHWLS